MKQLSLKLRVFTNDRSRLCGVLRALKDHLALSFKQLVGVVWALIAFATSPGAAFAQSEVDCDGTAHDCWLQSYKLVVTRLTGIENPIVAERKQQVELPANRLLFYQDAGICSQDEDLMYVTVKINPGSKVTMIHVFYWDPNACAWNELPGAVITQEFLSIDQGGGFATYTTELWCGETLLQSTPGSADKPYILLPLKSPQRQGKLVTVQFSPEVEIQYLAPAPPDPLDCGPSSLEEKTLGEQDPQLLPSGSFAADPIHVPSGAHIIRHSLLQSSGARTLSLDLEYISALVTKQGPLGYGWAHNFQTSISLDPSETKCTIHWNQNRKTVFAKVEETPLDVTYRAPEATHYQFDRVILTKATRQFVYRSKEDDRIEFDANGRILRELDRYGFALDYTLDANGLPITVTEPITGTGFRFTHTTGGRLNRVTEFRLAFPPNATPQDIREVVFSYKDNNPDLVAAIELRTELPSLIEGNGGRISSLLRRYDYTSDKRVQSGQDEEGRREFWNEYYSDGRIRRQLDALNRSTEFSYTDLLDPALINVLPTVDPNVPAVRVQVTQRNGSIRTLTANKNLDILELKNERNETTRMSYESRGLLKVFTDERNHSSSVEFDENGFPRSAINSLGDGWQYHYDERGNLGEVINPRGGIVRASYMAGRNLLTNIVDEVGRTSAWHYGSDFLLRTNRLPNGQAVAFEHVRGRVARIAGKAHTTVLVTYNEIGLPETVAEGISLPQSFKYDLQGRTTRVKDETGHTILLQNFDSRGLPISVTDRYGQTYTFTYDELGLLRKIANPVRGTMMLTYDSMDRLTNVVSFEGRTCSYGHDAVGRIEKVEVPGINPLLFNYDAAGNVKSIREGDSKDPIWRAEYDERNWVVAEKNASGNAWTTTYNSMGQVATFQQPGGAIDYFSHDSIGRTTGILDPLQRVTRITYDDKTGNVALTNARQAGFRFEVDEAYRIVREKDPDNRALISKYNERGLIERSDFPSGKALEFKYEARGLLERITYAQGAQTFTHDDPGNLRTASRDGETVTLDWTEFGELKSFETPSDGKVSYSYDKDGTLASVTYPGKGAVVYEPDAQGRLWKIHDWRSRTTIFEYDLNGRLKKVSRPNSTSLTYGYDSDGRLARMEDRDASGGVIVDLTLEYDVNSRIAAIESPLAVDYSGIPGFIATYNQKNQRTGAGITHDPDGNMTSGPTLNADGMNFAYDGLQRLTRGGNVSYSYDALGFRRSKTTTEGVTHYLPNMLHRSGAPLAEKLPGGQTRWFVHGLGVLYQEESDGSARFYHYDHQGNTVALTDDAGRVVQRFDYTPFGLPLFNLQAALSRTPFLYNGRHGAVSDENGLIHMGARYYNPLLRRFLSQDPLGLGGGLNYYAFGLNNPVQFIDPTGLEAESVGSTPGQGPAPSIFDGLNSAFRGILPESYAARFVGFNHPRPEGISQFAHGTPLLGTGIALSEVITGTDPITMQPTSRIGALANVAFSVLPFLKVKSPLAAESVAKSVSGVAKAAKGITEGSHVVYQGVDKAGVVRYVGITERGVATRAAEHVASGQGKEKLIYSAIQGAQNLTKQNARIWEQKLINQYGLGKNGGQLLNKINSISSKFWESLGIER
jgi:RHS repeat-associated protein